jgi:hypothetical protein
MNPFVTKKELEQYSKEVQKWMIDQILLNYNQGRRITELEKRLDIVIKEMTNTTKDEGECNQLTLP